MAQHVYHWKHGWIPLTHAAALSKAKGNHAKAAELMAAAHSPDAGIHSRQHVAKAAIAVPHLPAADRPDAMRQVREAAQRHDATDLVPSLAGKRAERAAQTPRQIHDRLTADPSKVSMDELHRLARLGGKFAPAARAEIARRDAAEMKRKGQSPFANFNPRTGRIEH